MDKNKIAVAVFDKSAVRYQDKFMDLDLYHDSFNAFCEAIDKENAEVLEIACGPGNITRYLLKKRPGYRILATDLSVNMLELARINNPAAGFMLMDGRQMDQLDGQFDAIMCGFFLPYLSKEEAVQWISDSARKLRPGGVLYISTMEDDYAKSGFAGPETEGEDRLFIHYHEAGYLTEALKNNRFELIDLRRQPYPEQDGSVTTDLIILAKYGEANPH